VASYPSCRLTLSLALSVAVTGANAQQKNQFPNDQRLREEMQRIEKQRLQPFDEATGKVAPNSFPNISKEMLGKPIDIQSIASQYRANVPAVKPDDLFVFASFSMPPAALENLFRDVAKVDAVVVFRGFKNNSWRETAEMIASLKNNGVNAVVNPTAFKTYKIDVVPAVVITKPEAHEQTDGEGCALPEHYGVVIGDVTLEYALTQITKKNPTWRAHADPYLKTLRGQL
jgi:conjugal transfer pilus assembly protein TrbC